MMQTLTFEKLPELVHDLNKKIEKIEQLLVDQQKEKDQQKDDQPITIQGASEILHLRIPTIYSKVSRGELPGIMKRGKRLYFSRAKLIEYLRSGERKTDYADKAHEFIEKKKGSK